MSGSILGSLSRVLFGPPQPVAPHAGLKSTEDVAEAAWQSLKPQIEDWLRCDPSIGAKDETFDVGASVSVADFNRFPKAERMLWDRVTALFDRSEAWDFDSFRREPGNETNRFELSFAPRTAPLPSSEPTPIFQIVIPREWVNRSLDPARKVLAMPPAKLGAEERAAARNVAETVELGSKAA